MSNIFNHPVHIVDANLTLAPSSFIPFCEFGGNMTALGVKIDQFDMPVCNSFKPKLLEHQLCYGINIKDYFQQPTSNDLKNGLIFILDYNEDRQINSYEDQDYNKEIKSMIQRGNLFL